MNFVRKVANSDILAIIIEIPESVKNKKVEILILPYEAVVEEQKKVQRPKGYLRGILMKYKNTDLKARENDAWAIQLHTRDFTFDRNEANKR